MLIEKQRFEEKFLKSLFLTVQSCVNATYRICFEAVFVTCMIFRVSRSGV